MPNSSSTTDTSAWDTPKIVGVVLAAILLVIEGGLLFMAILTHREVLRRLQAVGVSFRPDYWLIPEGTTSSDPIARKME
ncbi:uncharacterized protein N7458_000149 [Penicillium daleae]|uniref:Uncharacterized protein n=1 Tax=Penicillium daleae TaxID=63821 RepID=A0AAD6CFL8_9EURO|nr:uncharacterized protein N7458_000149 [Penicillium daleae]KAJ5464463.1 hypothetical protein N7458_000149 [Penicillium daleae]